jgi:hypothetical protein
LARLRSVVSFTAPRVERDRRLAPDVYLGDVPLCFSADIVRRLVSQALRDRSPLSPFHFYRCYLA